MLNQNHCSRIRVVGREGRRQGNFEKCVRISASPLSV